MSCKSLRDFQLNYEKLQEKVYFVLNILQCYSTNDAKYPILRKFISPGIVAIFLLTNGLSLFCEIEGDLIMVMTACIVIFIGIAQILSKIIVMVFSMKKIEDLVDWIHTVHQDPSWYNLGSFVEQHLQVTLRYANIGAK